MPSAESDRRREIVRANYATAAGADNSRRVAGQPCCGANAVDESKAVGYSAEELAVLPDGADLGLGCGTPLRAARLQPGETVMDLGSGAGIDCFLAAREVGPAGHVIGVDMTSEMVQRARENARQADHANVEFRLGEIEHLPVADNAVDAIISNCVINLSPDKAQVYRDAFRVLRPGGRFVVSDMVEIRSMPAEFADDARLMACCVAGARPPSEVEALLREAGFTDIRTAVSETSRAFVKDWVPGSNAEDYVASATITARKPLSGELPTAPQAKCGCG